LPYLVRSAYLFFLALIRELLGFKDQCLLDPVCRGLCDLSFLDPLGADNGIGMPLEPVLQVRVREVVGYIFKEFPIKCFRIPGKGFNVSGDHVERRLRVTHWIFTDHEVGKKLVRVQHLFEFLFTITPGQVHVYARIPALGQA